MHFFIISETNCLFALTVDGIIHAHQIFPEQSRTHLKLQEWSLLRQPSIRMLVLPSWDSPFGPLHQGSVSLSDVLLTPSLTPAPEIRDSPLSVIAHEAEVEEADQLKVKNLQPFTCCVIWLGDHK